VAFDSPRFALSDERPDSETLILTVTGEIHVSTAPAFSARLTESIAGAVDAMVIDLSEVAFIDSTGLSVLLDGLRRVTLCGGHLALVVTNPTVLRLFEITKLDATFDIQPTRAAALERVRHRGSAPPSAAA
jgi:anti-anti-sigma factor